MTETELAALIERGTTRYAGEWHLKSCADEAQGAWCTEECAKVRESIRRAGMTVDCPVDMSWREFTIRMATFGAELHDDGDDYPPSDGAYYPKPTVPADPPRDDDSYGTEVSHG